MISVARGACSMRQQLRPGSSIGRVFRFCIGQPLTQRLRGGHWQPRGAEHGPRKDRCRPMVRHKPVRADKPTTAQTLAAWLVHMFTASGAILALLALLAV